ncbi:Sporulation related domain-containing protein [Paucidesulfovibrio gracilis DSM 16080]|uniref:Sporulation related domain-containing protein n=1 Tax=Paucidesulfovibrio gracilis DSM 16080 TaxID=1121449 RepID=A0A1T4XNE2_9BACT|nr:SPOR domain-containing protein [Paucidesulfovibrio gracilis]SKA90631.1 Sporulation related domain-containing protein [Paucidesulfovibrio gracilis DSM 16080]
MRTTLISLIGLLLLAALHGCATMTTDAEDLAMPGLAQSGNELTPDQRRRLGDRLLEEGRDQAAYLHFQQALDALAGAPEDDPARLDLRARKARVLLRQERHEAALAEFRAVLRINPDHVLANLGAGAVYLHAGLHPEARTHLERATASDDADWRAYQLLGVLLSREGQPREAIVALERALERQPDQPETLNSLGMARLMLGEHETALHAFRKALLAGAPKQQTYNNLGLVLARMGHHDQALEAFRYAGDEAGAYNNLGYVLLLQGEFREAVHCFRKALEQSPTHYAKAFENLKQARMAMRFASSPEQEPQAAASEPLQPVPALTSAPRNADIHPAEALRSWGILVASFPTESAARAEADRLATLGLECRVLRTDLASKGIWFRVLTGCHADPEQVRAQLARVAGILGLDDPQRLFVTSFETAPRPSPPVRRAL